MINFIYHNPTTLHFGRNVLKDLGATITLYGKRVLLVYGKGSVKKSGLYDQVITILDKAGAEVFEYSGIQSNPVVQDVDAAAAIGRENKVDVILAVGGGSVIDSSKIISITIPVNHTAWDFMSYKAKPLEAIPLIAILTLAATGTEMNSFAVISNHEVQVKDGYGSPLIYPAHSFLDPQLTCSVPKNYTAYGVADLIAHSLEAWFGAGEATLSDRFVISIIREAIETGPPLMNDLQNYSLREKIMYAATMALNGLTLHGRISGDWGVHSIGHILSLLYDVPHGASLTIVYPAWMRFIKNRCPERVALLGSELFREKLSADETIGRIETFFRSIGCPVRLSELNIPNVQKEMIYKTMVSNKVSGVNLKLKETDYREIIELFV